MAFCWRNSVAHAGLYHFGIVYAFVCETTEPKARSTGLFARSAFTLELRSLDGLRRTILTRTVSVSVYVLTLAPLALDGRFEPYAHPPGERDNSGHGLRDLQGSHRACHCQARQMLKTAEA